MRSRALLIGGIGGAILGGVIAWVGATFVFGCRYSVERVPTLACPAPNIGLAVAWGIPIGLLIGLAAAFLISRRRASTPT